MHLLSLIVVSLFVVSQVNSFCCGGGGGGGGCGCGRKKRSIDSPPPFTNLAGNGDQMLCNSPELKEILLENIRDDPSQSGKSIAANLEAAGDRYVVVCSTGPFDFFIHPDMEFCGARNSTHHYLAGRFLLRVGVFVLIASIVMLIVVFILLHCHFIYSTVAGAFRNATIPRVNQTAHDYPDYEQFRPEPDRGVDYDVMSSQPARIFPQLVTLPDYPPRPSDRRSEMGPPSNPPRFGLHGYANEFRGRSNAYVMGNPRLRYRPSLPRTNPNYPQQQSIYGSPMGYSYAGYIERQARRFPIMMYTLVQCVPCQRAKHLLAVSYSDVAAHFLELVGDEDWQRQLQVDLQQITGQARQTCSAYIRVANFGQC